MWFLVHIARLPIDAINMRYLLRNCYVLMIFFILVMIVKIERKDLTKLEKVGGGSFGVVHK